MKPESFSLQRRNVIERRVLRLLRGEGIEGIYGQRHMREQAPDQAMTQADLEKFLLLRREAMRNGLSMKDVDFPYVSPEELQILSWIAGYQRVAGLKELCHKDVSLSLSLAHCAGILSGLGLRLPASIFYKNNPVAV
jgi:hypothetical protein